MMLSFDDFRRSFFNFRKSPGSKNIFFRDESFVEDIYSIFFSISKHDGRLIPLEVTEESIYEICSLFPGIPRPAAWNSAQIFMPFSPRGKFRKSGPRLSHGIDLLPYFFNIKSCRLQIIRRENILQNKYLYPRIPQV